jgi:S1-C subfamily serine protease
MSLDMLVFKRDKDRKGDEIDGLGGFVGLSLQAADHGKSIQVAAVLKDSPAMKAGLKKDDALVKVGDVEATDLRSVVTRVRQAKPGSELLVRVRRGDKDQELKVKVGVLPFVLLD